MRRRLGFGCRLQSEKRRLSDRFETASSARTYMTMVAVTSSSSSMRMTVMVVARGDHADEVDGQSQRGDDEQLPRVHLGRVEKALNGLEDDKD